MSSKLISTTLLLSFISIVQATEKVQIAVIESQGVVLTPNKSAIQKFAHGGFAKKHITKAIKRISIKNHH